MFAHTLDNVSTNVCITATFNDDIAHTLDNVSTNVCITATFNDDIAHTFDNVSSSSILYIIMSYCQFK